MTQVQKSLTTLGLDQILENVVNCLLETEPKARSKKEIHMIDVSRRGLRQDLYVGKLMIIPHGVMDDLDKIPHPLLTGAALKLFDGEDAMALTLHRLATCEFDKLTKKDIEDYKDKVFRSEGKLGSIVLFQPAWANPRDFHGFVFTKDRDKLCTLVRHLVFSAYFNPSLSALFDTLSTSALKLDAKELEHDHLGLGYAFQSETPDVPLLQKQGGLKTAAFHKIAPHEMLASYLETALLLMDEEQVAEAGIEFTIDDYSDDALLKAEEDCLTFLDMAGDLTTGMSQETIGRLFWLNRNGHGSGFWDESSVSEEVGEKLSEIAHQFGECDLYISDDNQLEFHGGHLPAPMPEEGSGHQILPKNSSMIRLHKANLKQIIAESLAPEEEAMLAEFETQLEKKLTASVDRATPTTERSGFGQSEDAPTIDQQGMGKDASCEVLNGYTQMRTELESDFAGDPRDADTDHAGLIKQAATAEIAGIANKIVTQHHGEYFTYDTLVRLIRNYHPRVQIWPHIERPDDYKEVIEFMVDQNLLKEVGNRLLVQTRDHITAAFIPKKASQGKRALTYVHPGQVLEQFYPELLSEMSDYPMGYPERNYTAPALQMQEGNIGDPSVITVEDYSDEGMPHPLGQPGLIPTQDLQSVPLKPGERSIRGPFFNDQFYRIHTDIAPAMLTMKASLSKVAAKELSKKDAIAVFLKKISAEIASSLLAAFIATNGKPLFTYTPSMSSVNLCDMASWAAPGLAPLMQADNPLSGQLKSLFNGINDGDLTDALNGAWSQGAVWHDSEQGRILYEVFVRIEEIDTETMILRYKYITGVKE